MSLKSATTEESEKEEQPTAFFENISKSICHSRTHRYFVIQTIQIEPPIELVAKCSPKGTARKIETYNFQTNHPLSTSNVDSSLIN